MVNEFYLISVYLMFFQYSLCRVVLMVGASAIASGHVLLFQYSLCRRGEEEDRQDSDVAMCCSFSTRSVESF